MMTMRASWEGDDLWSALGGVIAVIKFPHPRTIRQRIIREINEAAFDIEIARSDSILSLSGGELEIIGWEKQMDFLHVAIHELTRIMPEIDIAMELCIIFQDIPLEEKCTATAVIVELIDHTATMRADKMSI